MSQERQWRTWHGDPLIMAAIHYLDSPTDYREAIAPRPSPAEIERRWRQVKRESRKERAMGIVLFLGCTLVSALFCVGLYNACTWLWDAVLQLFS